MIYKFLRGVRAKFTDFSENVLDSRSYFIPCSNREVCDAGSYIMTRSFSDRVKVLSGLWDFWYYKDGFFADDFSTELVGGHEIQVPSSWENARFEPVKFCETYPFPIKPFKVPKGKKSGNSVGIYRKMLSFENLNSNYKLKFLNVSGSFEVHLNGVYVGFSALSTAEFDLSSFIREGDNELVVAVTKWTAASYLEGGQAFASTGITGDVYLTEQKAVSLFDFDFRCERREDVYHATLSLAFNSDGSDTMAEISLEKGGAKIFESATAISDSVAVVPFEGAFENYTAEMPVLYDLYVRIVRNGVALECTKSRVGFGYTETVDGNTLYCGEPLKLRGVNYNAIYNEHSKPMTGGDVEKDLNLIRAYRFNTIQTTGYSDPTFLLFAAEKGLYIVDRVRVDTSAFGKVNPKKRDNMMNDRFFNAAVVDKTAELYNRDKCFANVIGFSFGGENGGTKNIENAVFYLKEKTDKKIFVKNFEEHTDTAVAVNPSIEELIDEINRVMAKKAVFMTEYARSGGNGSANLAEFDDIIDNTACCIGGCLSYFLDDAAEGKTYRDDGLFNLQRKPYAGALNHKFVTRPINFSLLSEDKIQLFNTRYFTDTSDIDIVIKVIKNGRVQSTVVLNTVLEPRSVREVYIFCGHVEEEMYVIAECRLKDGTVISEEQAVLHTELRTIKPNKGESLSVREYLGEIDIYFDSGIVRFNRKLGTITGYSLMGKEVLFPMPNRLGGQCFNTMIDRPFVRNIRNKKYNPAEYVLQDFEIRSDTNNGLSTVTVETETLVKKNGRSAYLVQDKYLVYANGTIEVFSVLNPYKKCPVQMDCFAKQLRLHDTFRNVAYYGKGSGDNYIDLCNHSLTNLYEDNAKNMASSCAIGQESGNRTDVHFVRVTDGEGDGLLINGCTAPFQLKIGVATNERLIESYRQKKNPFPDAVYADIAAFVGGIGDGNHGAPMSKYLMKSSEYILHFNVMPVYGRRCNEKIEIDS